MFKKIDSELLRFEREYCAGRNLKRNTSRIYIGQAKEFGKFLEERNRDSFLKATKGDIADYFASLKGQPVTIASKKLTLKVFYRFFNKPQLVNWFTVRKPAMTKIGASDILQPDEFLKLLSACRTVRDRALLQMLYETGARVGEILSLTIGDIVFTDNSVYANIRVSKTTPRKIYLFDSVMDIKNWLDMHPKRKPDSLLFVKGTGEALTYNSFYKLLLDITERAGVTKHIHPHLFRHSRASMDARGGMNTVLASVKFGWSPNSLMFNRYSHLTPEDIRDWDMKARGLKQKDEKSPQQSKECLRCRTMNPWTAKFCQACGMTLDRQKAEQMGNYEDTMNEAIVHALKNKKVAKVIADEIKKLRKGRKEEA